MTHPAQHVDTLTAAAGVPQQQTPPVARPRLIVAMIALPLFFITTFVLAYISSSHAPVPHHLALTLAGPSAVTQPIADQLDTEYPDAFDVTIAGDEVDASTQVSERQAVGVIAITNPQGQPASVTVWTASSGGRLAASAVQQVADGIGEQLGASVTVQDVAPLDESDGAGSGLFFYLVLCTMGAYLAITAIYRGLPHFGPAARLLSAGGISVMTPVVSFSALSLTYGGFGAPFNTLAAVLGVGILYTLTVALLAMFFYELVGNAAVFLVLVVCMAFNLPSSGGTTPPSMLPPFWQGVGDTWFGSSAMHSLQSIVYFDGNDITLWRLLVWLAGAAVAFSVTAIIKTRRRAKTDPVGRELSAPSHDDEKITQSTGDIDVDSDAQPGDKAPSPNSSARPMAPS